MLLSNAKRLKIQGIIKRIAQDKSITLEERIYVEKFAHHNSTISLWLKKANSFRSCLLYTSPSPRDKRQSRMPSSA